MNSMTKLKTVPHEARILMVLALALGFLALPGLAQGQDEAPAAPDSTLTVEEPEAAAVVDSVAIAEALGDSTAMVVLLGNELFPVHGASVISADDRAAALSEAIGEIAK